METLIRTLLRRIDELKDTVRFLEGKLFDLNAKATLSESFHLEDTLIQSDSFDVEESPILPDLDWDFETPKK